VNKPPASLEEICLASERIFDGTLLHVRRDKILLPNQRTSVREYINHPGAAVIVPVLQDGALLLERQYRYPLRDEIIEFPAGKLDSGEEPLATAQRELLEETGYRAETWHALGKIHPLPAYSDETIYCFVAENLTHEQICRDDDEFLELLSVAPSALSAAIRSGKITDAKTICAFFMFQVMKNEAKG
jgi:ADP-ribose pyrophosphatase